MRRPALLLALALLLAACETTEEVEGTAGSAAGGLGGIAVGGLTSNPLVGYAVGLGIRVAVDSALASWFRGLRTEEQDRIAAAAAGLAPGEARDWQVSHGLPFGWRDVGGRMEVTRVIETPLASCREVLFTLEDGAAGAAPSGIFVATACQQAAGWKWASAEPAVERWGVLH